MAVERAPTPASALKEAQKLAQTAESLEREKGRGITPENFFKNLDKLSTLKSELDTYSYILEFDTKWATPKLKQRAKKLADTLNKYADLTRQEISRQKIENYDKGVKALKTRFAKIRRSPSKNIGEYQSIISDFIDLRFAKYLGRAISPRETGKIRKDLNDKIRRISDSISDAERKIDRLTIKLANTDDKKTRGELEVQLGVLKANVRKNTRLLAKLKSSSPDYMMKVFRPVTGLKLGQYMARKEKLNTQISNKDIEGTFNVLIRGDDIVKMLEIELS